ncbi:MAG: acyltransferase [Prevotellaceae bacterium]|jgi:peptidoglycan/LPS O-acetylase OafA/YrhL|nr:acyltransferase [Prevotellaceae bacterium]
MQTNNQDNKLTYIDTLRGIAILGVIMIHTNQHGQPSDRLLWLINNGDMGVQLFFVASAFTLFLSFNNRLGKEKTPTRNFFIRRFFRIAPMYYLIGIGYYILQDSLGQRYWLGDETHITTWNIISNFFFVHGVNPYWINSLVPGGWSITVEMTFYAILPFLFSKIKNINQALNFFILSIFIRATLHVFIKHLPFFNLDQHVWTGFLYWYFPSQLPVFALGIIMYFVINKSYSDISGQTFLLLALVFLFQQLTGYNIFGRHIMFSIGFIILGVALSRYQTKILVNSIITYIGKISFSMYLVHFAVLHWLTYFHFADFVENGLINYSIRFFIVILGTVVLSTLTYKFIELPFQDFGKKIIKRLDNEEIETN